MKVTLHDILTPGDIPKTSNTGKGSCHWLWPSEEAKFRALKGDAPYGESGVTYSFNSYGYRAPEFSMRGEINIVAAGCSFVFGLGLPAERVAVEIIRQEIEQLTKRKTVLWNLAWPGASNDFIVRTLALAVPRLNPDLVIAGFTALARREYVTPDGQVMSFLPGHAYDYNPVFAECAASYRLLVSSPDDRRNFFVNYTYLTSILAGREWLFSFPSTAVLEEVRDLLTLDRFAGVLVEHNRKLDFARDMEHPGATHHALLAQSCVRRLRSLGWFERW
jgi:hypothetical protein